MCIEVGLEAFDDVVAPNEDDAADARRFRKLLDGNGFLLEQQGLCGVRPVSDGEKTRARALIDALEEPAQ